MTDDQSAPELTARQEWQQRWPLVLAAVLGFSFHSLMTSFAGLFIGPVLMALLVSIWREWIRETAVIDAPVPGAENTP